MGGYGVNPVLGGLVQAFSMANVMQNQRMQQEQLQLQKNRDARQEAHQNFAEQTSALNSGAKPLDLAGQFSQQQTVPSSVPGMPDTAFTMGGIPANPGQVTSIGGNQYQLPTKQDQEDSAFEQKIKQGRALSDIGAQAKIAEIKAKADADRDDRQLQIPGYDKPIDSRAVSYITELKRAEQSDKNDLRNRTSMEGIAKDKNQTALTVAGMRANAEGKTARGLTANGQMQKDLSDRRELDTDNKAVQEAQTKEQKLWGEIAQRKSQIDSNQFLKDGQSSDLNPLQAAKFKSEMASKRKEIDVLQSTQKKLIEKHGGTYTNGAASAAAGAGLVNPYETAK
jgi:hypothetical protein